MKTQILVIIDHSATIVQPGEILQNIREHVENEAREVWTSVTQPTRVRALEVKVSEGGLDGYEVIKAVRK